jgi:hypothetical protein
VKFDVLGRFKLEVVREQDQWVAYRLEPGKRMKLPELAIPAMLEPLEIAEYLDDLYHEMAKPGQAVREIQ